MPRKFPDDDWPDLLKPWPLWQVWMFFILLAVAVLVAIVAAAVN